MGAKEGSERREAARTSAGRSGTDSGLRSDVRSLLSAPAEALDDAQIDAVAAKLQKLGRMATLELACRIGETIFHDIFKGSVELVHGPGRKLPSFRRLASHPMVPYGASTLWRSVGVYALSRRMPHLFQEGRLGISHFRAVLGLPEPTQQRLLQAAAADGWTKTKLETEASAVRRVAGRRGRKPLPPIVKAVRRLRRTLESNERALVADAAQLNEESVTEALDVIRQARNWCERLERLLVGTRPERSGRTLER